MKRLLKKIFIPLLVTAFILPITMLTAKTSKVYASSSSGEVLVSSQTEQGNQPDLLWLMILLSITFIVLCFAVFIVLDYKYKKGRDGQKTKSFAPFLLLASSNIFFKQLVGVIVLFLLNALAVTALILVIKYDFFKQKLPPKEEEKKEE